MLSVARFILHITFLVGDLSQINIVCTYDFCCCGCSQNDIIIYVYVGFCSQVAKCGSHIFLITSLRELYMYIVRGLTLWSPYFFLVENYGR
jgi:hypothetical protein